MRLKKSLCTIAAVMVVFPVTVFSSDGARFDRAKVIGAEPIVRTVHVSTPRRDCWEEEVTYQRHYESATPAIFGGLVGGVIGHQFGKGRGKKAATAAGTLLGASIGRDAGHDAHAGSRGRTQQRCRVHDESYSEERIMGYHVTYRYHGQIYRTRMDHDPGDWVKVRVSVVTVD